VGELLGRHKDLLAAYVGLHDFQGLDLVSAFGLVLRGTSPPGEAQQLDRFCECLGSAWGRANSIDPETAYIFAFALVMLSTDLHAARTAATHERMTYEQFARNLQHALPEGSLAEHVLRESYERVRAGALLDARKGRRDSEDEGISNACARLRRAICRQPTAEAAALGRAEAAALHPIAGNLGDLWRALWSAAWAPLLGAFSAAAQRARLDGEGGGDEQLQELALRGLQLGLEASAILGEADRSQAFCAALQQLSLP